MGFSVLAARETRNESQKLKEGEGGRGTKETFPFFPTPSPLFYLRHFRAVSDSRSLSLTLNHKDMLATQAK